MGVVLQLPAHHASVRLDAVGRGTAARAPPGPTTSLAIRRANTARPISPRRDIARAAPLSPPRTRVSIRVPVATPLGCGCSSCCFVVHPSTIVLSSPRSLVCEAPSPRSDDRTTSTDSANVRAAPVRTRLHDRAPACRGMRSLTSRSRLLESPTRGDTLRVRPRGPRGARPTPPAASRGHQPRCVL